MPAASLSQRESAVAFALLDTLAPPGYASEAARPALLEALRRLAPHRLSKVRQLLRLLDTPVASLALGTAPRRFADLSLPQRERLLRAMADSAIPLLRTGFQTFKRLCGFIAYAVTDDGGANPLWRAIGYPGPRDDRPAALTPLPIFRPDRPSIGCDVIVVGSGAGGGVAAAVFARAGRKVVVLEAGPAADRAAFTQREADAFVGLYLDSAMTTTTDAAVAILAGACVGGGTTVNWCTSLRLEDAVAAQWRDASGGVDFAASLAPHYDAVSERLGLQIAPHNANNAVLVRGCEALGWHHGDLPRNASACGDGCGYCGFGCAYDNKRSVAETYLRDAVESGATIIAGARVERVSIRDGRATGVEATLSAARGAMPLHVDAPLVVLAAGSLRTPGILGQSGIGSPHLGRHLRLHPTTAAFARFDHPIATWQGVMQSAVSDRFADQHDHYGAKLEAVPAHPGLAAIAVPWRSQALHAELMGQFRHAAALIVLTRDRGEGSVTADPRADVRYAVDRYDGAHMLTALAGLAEIVFAAGAQSIVTLHADPIELRREQASRAGLDAFAAELRSRGVVPNRLGVFSAHQMGTCRIHRDPSRGVVDETGAVHGMRGLLVADASVFPLASGVNPMLTIMALAHRTASSHAR